METRGVITIENRTVVMPDAEVWMTIGELANLFYVRGVSVEAAILRLGKDGLWAESHAAGYVWAKSATRKCTAWKRSSPCRSGSTRGRRPCSASGLPGRRHVPGKSLRSCSCTIRMVRIAERHRHGLK